MAQFFFEREVRTPNGECYTILEDGKPIGRLDLHFVPGMVHGTMIVSESMTQEEIQELISMVDEDLTDAVGIEREDLVVHVRVGFDFAVQANASRPSGINQRYLLIWIALIWREKLV